jgi:hypothetical protein
MVFSSILVSFDSMHWHWGKCFVAWKGQLTRGDEVVPTLTLAPRDLWIWHAFLVLQDPTMNNVVQ